MTDAAPVDQARDRDCKLLRKRLASSSDGALEKGVIGIGQIAEENIWQGELEANPY